MNGPDNRGIVGFYSSILKLKTLKRSGWARKGIKNPETVASHAYGVSALAWMLSARGSVRPDLEKIFKMVIVHDLAEAGCGDMTPHDKAYKRKRQIEEDSLRMIVSPLPKKLREEMLALYREAEDCRTPEARVVETEDKADMLLTAAEYQKSTGKDLGEFFDLKIWSKKFTKDGTSLQKYLKSLGARK